MSSPASRVLLIDDQADLRVVIRVSLRLHAEPVEVREADSAASGLALAKIWQPDAIILDQEMPHRTGLEALADLRRAAPEACIVMFSSSDDPALADDARARGADAFVMKAEGAEAVVKVIFGAA